MSRVVTVNVTQRDIERGVPRSSCQCPIARAMRRKIDTDLRVGSEIWWFPDQAESEDLPNNVTTWIRTFDAGLPVKPFKFKLEVPE